jgi:endonuclease/exonuclease/phosphatase family metal-dependent hydrolase
MKTEEVKPQQYIAGISLFGILFLFFFQLLSDFVGSIYAFGLMGTSIPVEIVAVLLFFSPVVLLFRRKGISGWTLVFLGELVIVTRVLEVILDTRFRMLVSGLGVACFLVFFPSLLWNLGRDKRNPGGWVLSAGLAVGVFVSILLRTLHSGVDISTEAQYDFIGWILAAIGALLLITRFIPGNELNEIELPTNDTENKKKPGFGLVSGLSLGVMAVFVLFYFAFAGPNVIARWTAGSYPWVITILVLAFTLVSVLMGRSWFNRLLTPGLLLVWNILFVFSMTMTIVLHQINFPYDPGAYPLHEPQVNPISNVLLFLMLVLSPILIIDFWLYVQELIHIKPGSRKLGGAFVISALFLLVMVFAHVFTTVYDYIPVVGPFFRDKFWLVYLVAGLVVFLPLLWVKKTSFDFILPSGRLTASNVLTLSLIVIGLAGVFAVWVCGPTPIAADGENTSLKVLTYNIQQGYSDDGLKNYTGQLELIRELDADIIGLQESDTNRISGGNTDVVRYFADNLNLYSYYGPKTVLGTFGIALLSKYPLENPRTFYMYSEREQTATIHAQITVGEIKYNIYVTHLGNGGPILQQGAILKEVDGTEDVVLMGDFNFKPDTPQYQLTIDLLGDAWLLKWPDGIDDQGMNPINRIDHVFVSPGMTVTEAEYIYSPASDHPAEVVTIEW